MKNVARILYGGLAAALLLAFPGCRSTGAVEESGGPASDPSSATAYSSSARILCYNVFYQEVESRQQDILAYIRGVDADVMGLQEVTAVWRGYINAALVDTGEYAAFGYSRIGVAWEDEESPPGTVEFNVILYKADKYELLDTGHFWISTTPDVYSAQIEGGIVSQTPRCINWVLLKDVATGGEFVFLNAHLDAYSEPVRNFSTKLIADQMKSKAKRYPVVMAGDWNAQPSSDAIRTLLSNGYLNTRYEADETTARGTFTGWELEEGAWKFGDILFINEGKAHIRKFDVQLPEKDGKYLSDHHPLIMDMSY